MARTDYGAILSTVIKDTSDAIREVNGTSALIAPNAWGVNIRTMKSADDYENVLDQLIQEEVASAPVATFSDGANDIPLKDLSLSINPTQSGSGDPAPDNIRPITGVSSVNVYRTGKNFIDLSLSNLEQGGINGNTGALENLSNRVRNANYYPFPFDTLYDKGTIITIPSGYRLAMRFYDKNGSYISGTGSPIGFITELQSYFYGKGVEFVKFLFARTDNANITPSDISVLTYQLEIGSIGTPYEPYTGNTYLIQLGDTYYGATLDVVRGKLVADKLMVEPRTLGAFRTNALGHTQARYSNSSIGSQTNASICNCLKYQAGGYNYGNINTFYNSAGYLYFNFDETVVTTLEEAEQFMADNNVMCVAPLATPIEIDLTPTQINSLLGSNHIWHDGNGDTNCAYYANGQLYVEQHST